MRNIRKIYNSRVNFRSNWKNFLLLTVGALILAVNLNIFLAPSNLAPGGVMGVAVIVNEAVKLEVRPGKRCINAQSAIVLPAHSGLQPCATRTPRVRIEITPRECSQFERDQLVFEVDLEQRHFVIQGVGTALVANFVVVCCLRPERLVEAATGIGIGQLRRTLGPPGLSRHR